MLALSRRLFNDFPSFDRQVDRFFNDAWNRDIRLLPNSRAFRPELDAFERDGQHVYRLALPGVDPADVDLSVVDGRLTVQVERKEPSDVKQDDWHVRGFSYGTYEQTLLLPKGTDLDRIEASFNNGVLEITVPLAPAALPKKIEVKALGGRKLKATA